MGQINLPNNSKVTKGKYFKDKTGSKNLRKINVQKDLIRSETLTAQQKPLN